jgi:catechol 1,2-dioxygenase
LVRMRALGDFVYPRAGQRGEYRFGSNVPVSYGGRPPHIHVRVRAPGLEEQVTQHYPERRQ